LYRYSATGNTFLIGDGRNGEAAKLSLEEIKRLCDKAGVDGLIFLEESKNPEADFHMKYFNRDGGEVGMCGNGARSILHFASKVLEIESNKGEYKFSTLNSLYMGKSSENFPVQMTELYDEAKYEVGDLYKEAMDSYFMNTGVPHCLYLVEDAEKVELDSAGEFIRFHERFKGGTNANFFHKTGEQTLRMRTYERGVDGETDSCGTGATAAALMMAKKQGWKSPVSIKVNGGDLTISFNEDYSEVFLAGPVNFQGEYLE